MDDQEDLIDSSRSSSDVTEDSWPNLTRFQMHYDDGASGDHTFKLAQLISAHGLTGKVYTASYTVLSKLGHITSNRPTFTKAND